MKDWIMGMPVPARAVLGMVLAALLLVVWLIVSTLLGWLLNNVETMSSTEPRIARLAGYASVETRIAETVTALEAQASALAFPATMDTSQAGAQLQQQLRAFAEDAGLTVRGSQLVQKPAQSEEERSFDELTVQLTMNGEPIAIDDFLTQVHEAEPMMVIEALDVSRQRMSARERRRRQSTNTLNVDELNVIARITAARLVNP